MLVEHAPQRRAERLRELAGAQAMAFNEPKSIDQIQAPQLLTGSSAGSGGLKNKWWGDPPKDPPA